jgi:mono/diheme cytochrome c family protein
MQLRSILFVLALTPITACAATGAPPKIPVGQPVYKEHCAACHGEKGKPTVPRSPDFSSRKWQQSVKDDRLIKSTTNGAGGGSMPAYKGTLKPDQIKAVVAFIRTLGK